MGIKHKLEFDEDFVKKHKGPMKTFYKKSHKITRQHYAENIIIDCVNDYCLAEIFTYVPSCERPKIALVCKKWKRALDESWFKVRKIELPYWRYHEYSNCLNKFQTSDEKLNFLRSLLDKCGRYLTVLDLTAYGNCDIVPVINDSCPNLVKLRLRFASIQDTMLLNAFKRLSKLESLTIVFENMKGKYLPRTLLYSLRNVADTLTELNFLHLIDYIDDACSYQKGFHSVFPDLKALKSFEAAGIQFVPRAFMSLVRKRLSFWLNNECYLKELSLGTNSLANIKKLILNRYVITDDTLYFLANTMEGLEKFSFDVRRITDHGIVTLSKMHHLRTIRFLGPGIVTDSSIKLLKNLHSIYFPKSKKITEDSITTVIENSPDLRYFSLNDTVVTAEFFKKVAEIANSRKQLISYNIFPLLPDLELYESPYFKRKIEEDQQTSVQVPT